MKYYSEYTKKYYDTEEDCLNDENPFKEKLDKMAQRRAELDRLYEECIKAHKEYRTSLRKYLTDYGIYEKETRETSDNLEDLGTILKTFFSDPR